MSDSESRRSRLSRRRRLKYLSFEGRLLAPSHIFYIKGSSKMFFMEFEVLRVFHSDWKEDLFGSCLTVIFPVPSLAPELRFIQVDPQLGRIYSLSKLAKASLSLLSFQDQVYNVFKVGSESSLSLLPDSLSHESLLSNSDSFFSYKGIVTDDSEASSGVYTLDKIVRLLATNLAVVSNLRLFKKGMTLEIFNAHYAPSQSVIFLCGRSFVKAHPLGDSLHCKAAGDIYSADPIVDLSLDYNLGLKNILQVLEIKKSLCQVLPDMLKGGSVLSEVIKATLNISEFRTEYRSLVREFFTTKTKEAHDAFCVYGIDLFKRDLKAGPRPSIKAFKEAYLCRFLQEFQEESYSRWIPWSHSLIQVDPKESGALIGKLFMDPLTGRLTLKDRSESLPIALIQEGREDLNGQGFHDSLVVLSLYKFSLIFEKSSNWNKMYILISEGDLKKSLINYYPSRVDEFPDASLVDYEWVILRCSPPTNHKSSSSASLDFVVEGKSKGSDKTEYLAIPCSDTLYLQPGSRICHLREYQDRRKDFYRIYFGNARKSIFIDPRLDSALHSSCLASHSITEILPNTPMSGVNFTCIILRRWLMPGGKCKYGKVSKTNENVSTTDPSEFAFVNCQSLQLVVVEESSWDTEHSIYFNNRKNIPYPLGVLPGMKVLVTSLEADLAMNNKSRVYFSSTPMTNIVLLGFSEIGVTISKISDVKRDPKSSACLQAFVEKLKKLSVSILCGSCSTTLSPGGSCPYPGCHASSEPQVKLYALLELADESGETLIAMTNSKEVLQVLLCLEDMEWEDFIRAVNRSGPFTYIHKGLAKLPLIKLHGDTSLEDKELKSFTGYFYLLTEFQRLRYNIRLRPMKNNMDEHPDRFFLQHASPFNYDDQFS